MCAFLWQDWTDMAKTLSNDQISKLISSYHLRQEGLVNKNIVDTEKNSTLNIQPAGAQAVNIVETAEVDLPDVENVASDDENAASDDEDVASAASTTAVLGKATPWYGCSEAEKHNNRPYDKEFADYLQAINSFDIEYYREGQTPTFVESIMEGADQWGQIRKVRFAKGNAVVEKAWDESRFKDYGHRDAEFMNSAEICAYNKLRELQGNVIPWYYARGVRFNEKYDAVPLLLIEHIEGEMLHKWLKSERSDKEIETVKSSLDRSLQKFHKARWAHNSVYARNVMVQKDLSVVLIDLQRAMKRDGVESTRSGDLEHAARIWRKVKGA